MPVILVPVDDARARHKIYRTIRRGRNQSDACHCREAVHIPTLHERSGRPVARSANDESAPERRAEQGSTGQGFPASDDALR